MPGNNNTRIALGILAALLSNFLILGTTDPTLRLAGGLFVFCVIPGCLWLAALFPADSWRDGLERLPLGVGLSMALSILMLLSLQWLPGELTVGRVLLGNDLLIASGAILAVVRAARARPTKSQPGESLSRWAILLLLLIVLLGGALRVVNLGYSEFQDDEVDIVQVSMQAIQGERQAVLNDTRGPARTMMAAAFFLYTNRVGEVDVRWPAALASIAAILAIFCLGRRLFNPAVGLLAAAIVAVEGIVLGYGRIVQQESLVNLWAVLAILCFVVAANSRRERTETATYRVLGILLFTVGLLAHYEIALILPLLVWLWVAGERARPSRRFWSTVVISTLVVIWVLGTFYIPFFLSPGFSATYQHYSNDILGRGLADNLAQFTSVICFYNSVYLIVPMALLLVFAFSSMLACRRAWLGWFYGIGSLALWGMSLILPGQLALAGLLWFGSLVAAVFLIPPRETRAGSGERDAEASTFPASADQAFRIVLGWLMLYFIPYLYVVGLPRMHYYTFTLPWALAVGYGLHRLWGEIRLKPVRIGLACGLVLCYLLAVYHDVVLFVSHTPEWAMVQPEEPLPLHPRLHDGRPGEAFGFPQKSGWRALENLYRTGELRGPYETNELRQKVDWYLRRLLREPGENRYYFIAESPHRLQAGPPPEPFVPEDYREIGTVTVAGEPKLHIFEREHLALVRPNPTVCANEMFESMPGGVRSLDTYRLWWQYQADDQFYRDIAGFLETGSQAEGSIVLDHPAQVELLSAYYQGDAPYYPLPRWAGEPAQSVNEALEAAIAIHPKLSALLWAVDVADPDRHVERWLDENLFKAGEQWFGNVRLATYAAPGRPVGEMEHDVDVRLGDGIVLRGYSVYGGSFHGGEILPLRLFWELLSTSDPVRGRYKVFVHVIDADGLTVAQRDSEPAGGTRSTDTWLPGERVGDNQGVLLPSDLPAGSYRIAVGMYDPDTGVRLPAVDARGERLLDDRILLDSVEIEAP